MKMKYLISSVLITPLSISSSLSIKSLPIRTYIFTAATIATAAVVATPLLQKLLRQEKKTAHHSKALIRTKKIGAYELSLEFQKHAADPTLNSITIACSNSKFFILDFQNNKGEALLRNRYFTTRADDFETNHEIETFANKHLTTSLGANFPSHSFLFLFPDQTSIQMTPEIFEAFSSLLNSNHCFPTRAGATFTIAEWKVAQKIMKQIQDQYTQKQTLALLFGRHRAFALYYTYYCSNVGRFFMHIDPKTRKVSSFDPHLVSTKSLDTISLAIAYDTIRLGKKTFKDCSKKELIEIESPNCTLRIDLANKSVFLKDQNTTCSYHFSKTTSDVEVLEDGRSQTEYEYTSPLNSNWQKTINEAKTSPATWGLLEDTTHINGSEISYQETLSDVFLDEELLTMYAGLLKFKLFPRRPGNSVEQQEFDLAAKINRKICASFHQEDHVQKTQATLSLLFGKERAHLLFTLIQSFSDFSIPENIHVKIFKSTRYTILYSVYSTFGKNTIWVLDQNKELLATHHYMGEYLRLSGFTPYQHYSQHLCTQPAVFFNPKQNSPFDLRLEQLTLIDSNNSLIPIFFHKDTELRIPQNLFDTILNKYIAFLNSPEVFFPTRPGNSFTIQEFLFAMDIMVDLVSTHQFVEFQNTLTLLFGRDRAISLFFAIFNSNYFSIMNDINPRFKAAIILLYTKIQNLSEEYSDLLTPVCNLVFLEILRFIDHFDSDFTLTDDICQDILTKKMNYIDAIIKKYLLSKDPSPEDFYAYEKLSLCLEPHKTPNFFQNLNYSLYATSGEISSNKPLVNVSDHKYTPAEYGKFISIRHEGSFIRYAQIVMDELSCPYEKACLLIGDLLAGDQAHLLTN